MRLPASLRLLFAAAGAWAILLVAGGPSLVARAAPPAAAAAEIDWPQFRFDDDHTGSNPFETTIGTGNVARLQLSWAAQLGELVNDASPVIAGGIAYIASSDGTLWAWPADGCGQSLCTQPLWHSTSLAQIIDTPAVADGIVYVGSQTSFSSNDGKLDAFAAAGCGHLTCPPLWQGDAGKQAILESSPAVADGVVYIGAFDGRLYAFPAAGCGQALCPPLWTGRTGGSIESTPTVHDGQVYVASDDGQLHVFAAGGCGASTCRALWTGELGSAAFSSTPAIVDGVVYIGSQHKLSAFDTHGCGASRCDPLWRAIERRTFFNGSPAVADGRVYLPLEAGIGVYAAAGCGQPVCAPLFRLEGSGFQADIVSSPAVANGVVYAGRNTGEVLAWNAAGCGRKACDALWRATLPDTLVSSSPTVVNGRLYIGGTDDTAPANLQGRLYVFALPGAR
jgi:outer membrane protein assembly factor BamB